MIVQCFGCGGDVSTLAEKCPKCELAKPGDHAHHEQSAAARGKLATDAKASVGNHLKYLAWRTKFPSIEDDDDVLARYWPERDRHKCPECDLAIPLRSLLRAGKKETATCSHCGAPITQVAGCEFVPHRDPSEKHLELSCEQPALGLCFFPNQGLRAVCNKHRLRECERCKTFVSIDHVEIGETPERWVTGKATDLFPDGEPFQIPGSRWCHHRDRALCACPYAGPQVKIPV